MQIEEDLVDYEQIDLNMEMELKGDL